MPSLMVNRKPIRSATKTDALKQVIIADEDEDDRLFNFRKYLTNAIEILNHCDV